MGLSQEAIERKSAYIEQYQRDNYTNVSFKLRKVEDKEILDFLNSQPSKSEYIKGLIKIAMANSK